MRQLIGLVRFYETPCIAPKVVISRRSFKIPLRSFLCMSVLTLHARPARSRGETSRASKSNSSAGLRCSKNEATSDGLPICGHIVHYPNLCWGRMPLMGTAAVYPLLTLCRKSKRRRTRGDNSRAIRLRRKLV